MPNIAEVAADFAAPWRSAAYRTNGQSSGIDDVTGCDPGRDAGVDDVPCHGVDALRMRSLEGSASSAIEHPGLDGPSVTGDHFALFADMMIVRAGRRRPHCEIAVLTVRYGRIVKQRLSHE